MNRRNIKKTIITLGFLLLIPVNSWGEPSPGVRWLQNEPVSLLDWGLREANEEFERFLKKRIKTLPVASSVSGGVGYKSKENSISIITHIKDAKRNLTGEQCKENLSLMRELYLKDEGFCFLKKPCKRAIYLIENWFTHQHRGLFRGPLPKNLGEEMADQAKFTMLVENKDGSSYFCEMPLNGGPISVTRLSRSNQELIDELNERLEWSKALKEGRINELLEETPVDKSRER